MAELLLYRNAQPFGVTDPLFQRDVAFYVFQLPLWRRGLGWILAVLVLSLALTALVYFLGRVLVLTARGPVITARARAHLLGLLALLLLAKAADFWLDRYDLLYSQRGAVLGATYTDVHATCRRSGGSPSSPCSARSRLSFTSSAAAPARSWLASSCWPSGGSGASGVSDPRAAPPRRTERAGGRKPLHRPPHPAHAAGVRARPNRGA